jgi:hypothetical protein
MHDKYITGESGAQELDTTALYDDGYLIEFAQKVESIGDKRWQHQYRHKDTDAAIAFLVITEHDTGRQFIQPANPTENPYPSKRP